MINKAIVTAVLCVCPLVGQWRTGYYSSAPADGGLAVEDLYYSPFTHIVHYNSFPVVGGSRVSLDAVYYGVLNDADTLVRNAHAAHVRVLLCVGIGGAVDAMAKATDGAHLGPFVNAIMQFVSAHRYDGVDIDWEGSSYSPASYPSQFQNLLAALRARLDNYVSPLRGKGELAVFFGPPSLAAQNAHYIDQINVNCYDDFNFSFTHVWHNAALYDPLRKGDNRTCQNVVNAFVAAGVNPSRMGVGVPFYGYRWIGGIDAKGQGATYPGQVLTMPAKYDWRTYSALVADPKVWKDQYKRWDDNAKVPYLSIDNPGNSHDMLVTYENARSIAAKWDFVKREALGGITVYPIGGDWIPKGATAAERHPLAEALRVAVTSARRSLPTAKYGNTEKRHFVRSLLCLSSLFFVYLFLMLRDRSERRK